MPSIFSISGWAGKERFTIFFISGRARKETLSIFSFPGGPEKKVFYFFNSLVFLGFGAFLIVYRAKDLRLSGRGRITVRRARSTLFRVT